MSKLDLENMIIKLENNLYNTKYQKDEVITITFFEKGAIEVLGYLKELKQKDQRIAELEKDDETLSYKGRLAKCAEKEDDEIFI